MDGELFVGRTAELARLRDLLGGLSAGVGGMVLVEGEQGIGKSSLLRAALAGAAGSGCRVMWGAADELGQRFPLRLMAECLGAQGQAAILGQSDSDAPDRSSPEASGGGLVLLGADPVLAGAERLLALVDRLCAVSPVMLVAEDLQWADEASVLVWARLSRAVGQLPLLLAGSCRPGTGRDDLGRLRRLVSRAGSLMELGPLPETEMSELVGRLAGGRPGMRLAGLVGRAGGNPLYARELADGLVRDRRVVVDRGVAELAERSALVRVPASLVDAVGERLESLPEDTAAVLRWAAVLGVEFSVTDLEVVTGRSAGELMKAVDAAVGAGVVAEAGPRLAFRHGLIRQVLYEGMPAALRVALHLQAARALASAGAAPERVAAQLVPGQPAPGQSADLLTAEPSDAWVVTWLADTAPKLIYRAPEVAAELLRGVLATLADDHPRRETLEVSLVEAAFLLFRHDEVERVGGRALARAADPDKAAEIAWLVAYTLLLTGRAAMAAATAEKALARPETSDLQLARLRGLHAIILTVPGQLDQATQVAEVALADAERVGDSLAVGYALHALSIVCYQRPDHAARLSYIDRGLEVIGTGSRSTSLRLLLLFNRPAALTMLDRQAEALATTAQALVLAERAGAPRLPMIRTALASLYIEAGRWDDALAELDLVVGLPGPYYHELLMHGLFALIAVHRDDRELAREHLAAGGDPPFRDATYWSNAQDLMEARAIAAERAGQPAQGAALLAQFLDPDVSEKVADPFRLMPTMARLALAGGDRGAAEAAADAAEQEARAEPLAIKTAIAGYCRGLVTGDPAPVLAAAAYFQATGRPVDRAQALEEAAALLAARGDSLAARQALSESLDLYAALGAQWDIRRATSRLRPYGIRRGRGAQRTHPATGWAALTLTEVTVAHQVATGRSNPDIAAELFLSRNTVQTHVSHILAKLGARSRAEIVREALRHPSARESASA